MRCLIKGCKNPNIDMHHVKTRGSGGSDDENNLMPLCRWHHTEVHQIGMHKFSKKYEDVNNFLIANGWELDVSRNKWRLG